MTTCEDAEHVVAGRRFLIAAGVGVFRNPGIDGLPGVAADVRRVRELLEPMGYTCVLTDLADDPPRDALAEGIEDWTLEASLGPEDMVVVYFAGHGVCEEDRHYLLCADSRPGRWTRALAAEDLARPLVKSAVGHLLVILDTCYAGAGTADVSRLAADLADLHRGRANRWHLAAARARDRAKENVFVDALADVFAHPRHGATQRYVSVREVTERVNAHFRTHRPSQQARLTTTETDGQDPFFPSPVFLPGLPADGIDLAGLALLRRRYDPHYGPAAAGWNTLANAATTSPAAPAPWTNSPHSSPPRAGTTTARPASSPVTPARASRPCSDASSPSPARTPRGRAGTGTHPGANRGCGPIPP